MFIRNTLERSVGPMITQGGITRDLTKITNKDSQGFGLTSTSTYLDGSGHS